MPVRWAAFIPNEKTLGLSIVLGSLFDLSSHRTLLALLK
jgi:cell shape-determining protein MreD